MTFYDIIDVFTSSINHIHHKFITLSLRAVSINAPLSMIEFSTIHFTVILFFSQRWEIFSCLFIWTLFTFWRVFTFCSSLAWPFYPNWMVVHKMRWKENNKVANFIYREVAVYWIAMFAVNWLKAYTKEAFQKHFMTQQVPLSSLLSISILKSSSFK